MSKFKDIILVISAFILGGITMFLILNTPNNTKIYEKNSLSKSVSKIYNAVVLIQGYNGTALKETGTGFFYKKDNKYAYILTNEHVLTKSNTIKVVTAKDEEIEAEVLGKNEYLDLAVLRVDKKYAKLLATLGNSKKTNIGDTVFTVGSPLGYNYRNSVAAGVLSGKDRVITTTSTTDEDYLMKVIQVDASINPGNSGGPLLNTNGEVIGIVSLKLVDNDVEGMGFAIPIEYAMNYVGYLEKNEEIKWPTLGIEVTDSNDTSELLKNNIPIDTDIEGVLITNVNKNNKLKQGDIITKINNNKIKDTTYFKYELYQYKINDIIEITFIRNGKERKTKIVLS